jgi:hypothetical protein
MDPNAPEEPRDFTSLRLSRRWFPIASVVGAFGVVTAAVLRPGRPQPPPPAPGGPPAAPVPAAAPPRLFPRQYTPVGVLAAPGSAWEFRQSLADVAAGDGDAVYALGDGEIRVFGAGGAILRAWKVPEKTACLSVAPDGRVYVGSPGRIDIYDAAGVWVRRFRAGDNRPADITAVRAVGDAVLVADAGARVIRRYDTSGVERGRIGDRNKTGGFMLPNKSLDFDVGPDGTVHATDTGRHQVTSWKLDGTPAGAFGRFGVLRPEDFVGCCNPVNVAVAPDGSLVTAEKVAARVKVFAPDRTLLAVIGAGHFDPACRHINLAVDSKGRILAADPERRIITIFEQS